MKWLKSLKRKWKEDKRLVVKAILWELTGFITLFLWITLFPVSPAKTSIGYFLIRIVTYYVYHKWWKTNTWLKR